MLWPLLSVVSTVERPVGPRSRKCLKLMLENSQLNIQGEKTKDAAAKVRCANLREIKEATTRPANVASLQRRSALREAEGVAYEAGAF